MTFIIHNKPGYNYTGTKVRDLKAERERKNAKTRALQGEFSKRLTEGVESAKSKALKG